MFDSVRMILLAAMVISSAGISVAGDDVAKADKVITEATRMVETLVAAKKAMIPPSLMREAAGVAIFPGVVKGGFLLGAEVGDGLILRHDSRKDIWYGPAFYSISSVSFGLQAGVKGSDVLLVIRSERGMDGLLKNEVALGADMSVAAGPVGHGAGQSATDKKMNAEVLSYSKSAGIFGGIALEGAKITVREAWNKAYFGKAVPAKQILMETPAEGKKVDRLIRLLRQYGKRKGLD